MALLPWGDEGFGPNPNSSGQQAFRSAQQGAGAFAIAPVKNAATGLDALDLSTAPARISKRLLSARKLAQDEAYSGPVDDSAWGKIKEGLRRGTIGDEFRKTESKFASILAKDKSPEAEQAYQAFREIEKAWQSSLASDPVQSESRVFDAILQFVPSLPMMGKAAVLEAAPYLLLAAAGAIEPDPLVGKAGAVAAALRAVKGVSDAWRASKKVGAAGRLAWKAGEAAWGATATGITMFDDGRAQVFRTLKDGGVRPEVALPAANVGGALYAAAEGILSPLRFAGLRQGGAVTKAIESKINATAQRAIFKTIEKVGVDRVLAVLGEDFEEGAQGGIVGLTSYLAAKSQQDPDVVRSVAQEVSDGLGESSALSLVGGPEVKSAWDAFVKPFIAQAQQALPAVAGGALLGVPFVGTTTALSQGKLTELEQQEASGRQDGRAPVAVGGNDEERTANLLAAIEADAAIKNTKDDAERERTVRVENERLASVAAAADVEKKDLLRRERAIISAKYGLGPKDDEASGVLSKEKKAQAQDEYNQLKEAFVATAIDRTLPPAEQAADALRKWKLHEEDLVASERYQWKVAADYEKEQLDALRKKRSPDAVMSDIDKQQHKAKQDEYASQWKELLAEKERIDQGVAAAFANKDAAERIRLDAESKRVQEEMRQLDEKRKALDAVEPSRMSDEGPALTESAAQRGTKADMELKRQADEKTTRTERKLMAAFAEANTKRGNNQLAGLLVSEITDPDIQAYIKSKKGLSDKLVLRQTDIDSIARKYRERVNAVEVKPGPATQIVSETERTPVIVTGEATVGQDGTRYVTIEGSKTPVPLDQIEFQKERVYTDEETAKLQSIDAQRKRISKELRDFENERGGNRTIAEKLRAHDAKLEEERFAITNPTPKEGEAVWRVDISDSDKPARVRAQVPLERPTTDSGWKSRIFRTADHKDQEFVRKDGDYEAVLIGRYIPAVASTDAGPAKPQYVLRLRTNRGGKAVYGDVVREDNLSQWEALTTERRAANTTKAEGRAEAEVGVQKKAIGDPATLRRFTALQALRATITRGIGEKKPDEWAAFSYDGRMQRRRVKEWIKQRNAIDDQLAKQPLTSDKNLQSKLARTRSMASYEKLTGSRTVSVKDVLDSARVARILSEAALPGGTVEEMAASLQQAEAALEKLRTAAPGESIAIGDITRTAAEWREIAATRPPAPTGALRREVGQSPALYRDFLGAQPVTDTPNLPWLFQWWQTLMANNPKKEAVDLASFQKEWQTLQASRPVRQNVERSRLGKRTITTSERSADEEYRALLDAWHLRTERFLERLEQGAKLGRFLDSARINSAIRGLAPNARVTVSLGVPLRASAYAVSTKTKTRMSAADKARLESPESANVASLRAKSEYRQQLLDAAIARGDERAYPNEFARLTKERDKATARYEAARGRAAAVGKAAIQATIEDDYRSTSYPTTKTVAQWKAVLDRFSKTRVQEGPVRELFSLFAALNSLSGSDATDATAQRKIERVKADIAKLLGHRGPDGKWVAGREDVRAMLTAYVTQSKIVESLEARALRRAFETSLKGYAPGAQGFALAPESGDRAVDLETIQAAINSVADEAGLDRRQKTTLVEQVWELLGGVVRDSRGGSVSVDAMRDETGFEPTQSATDLLAGELPRADRRVGVEESLAEFLSAFPDPAAASKAIAEPAAAIIGARELELARADAAQTQQFANADRRLIQQERDAEKRAASLRTIGEPEVDVSARLNETRKAIEAERESIIARIAADILRKERLADNSPLLAKARAIALAEVKDRIEVAGGRDAFAKMTPDQMRQAIESPVAARTQATSGETPDQRAARITAQAENAAKLRRDYASLIGRAFTWGREALNNGIAPKQTEEYRVALANFSGSLRSTQRKLSAITELIRQWRTSGVVPTDDTADTPAMRKLRFAQKKTVPPNRSGQWYKLASEERDRLTAEAARLSEARKKFMAGTDANEQAQYAIGRTRAALNAAYEAEIAYRKHNPRGLQGERATAIETALGDLIKYGETLDQNSAGRTEVMRELRAMQARYRELVRGGAVEGKPNPFIVEKLAGSLTAAGVDPSLSTAQQAAQVSQLPPEQQAAAREDVRLLATERATTTTTRFQGASVSGDKPATRQNVAAFMSTVARVTGGAWSSGKQESGDIGMLRIGGTRVLVRWDSATAEGKTGPAMVQRTPSGDYLITVDPTNGRVTSAPHEIGHIAVDSLTPAQSATITSVVGYDINERGANGELVGEERFVNEIQTQRGRDRIAEAVMAADSKTRNIFVRWWNRLASFLNRMIPGVNLPRVLSRDARLLADGLRDFSILRQHRSAPLTSGVETRFETATAAPSRTFNSALRSMFEAGRSPRAEWIAAGKPGAYTQWVINNAPTKSAAIPSNDVESTLRSTVGVEPDPEGDRAGLLKRTLRMVTNFYGDTPEVMAKRLSPELGALASRDKVAGAHRQHALERVFRSFLESGRVRTAAQNARLYDDETVRDSTGAQFKMKRAQLLTLYGLTKQARLAEGLEAARGGPGAYKAYLADIEAREGKKIRRVVQQAQRGFLYRPRSGDESGALDPNFKQRFYLAHGNQGDSYRKWSAGDLVQMVNSSVDESMRAFYDVGREGFDLAGNAALYERDGGWDADNPPAAQHPDMIPNFIPTVRLALNDKGGVEDIGSPGARVTGREFNLDSDPSSVQERTVNSNPYRIYGFDHLLGRHNSEMARYVGWRRVGLSWQAALRAGREAIISKHGREMFNELWNHFNGLEGTIGQTPEGAENLMTSLLGRSARVLLQMPRVWAYQPVSFLSYARYYGAANVQRAFGEAMARKVVGNESVIDKIIESSHELSQRVRTAHIENMYPDESRYSNMFMAITGAHKSGAIPSAARVIGKTSNWLNGRMGWADEQAIRAGALAAWRYHKGLHPDMAEPELIRLVAKDLADKTTLTQTTTNPLAMTAGRKSQTFYNKVLTFMSGGTSASWNQFRSDLIDAKRARSSESYRNLGMTVTTLALQAAAIAGIRAAMTPSKPDDDDDESKREELAFGTVENIVSLLPLGQTFSASTMKAAATLLNSEDMRRKYGFLASLSGGDAPFRGLDRAGKGIDQLIRSQSSDLSEREATSLREYGLDNVVRGAGQIGDLMMGLNAYGLARWTKDVTDATRRRLEE